METNDKKQKDVVLQRQRAFEERGVAKLPTVSKEDELERERVKKSLKKLEAGAPKERAQKLKRDE
ncbi:MAG: hypothetical protein COU68_04920 [Candidatus Pacebacteria bacterium CG10_big_fil_rev_8_21_14_0_10_45_6]|nr:MAG: hypothetical protein COU68_04920 [Candidatus Pacebacteria bacterium CG10_big_fil_rev_8_21_14_0_10_45_6]